MFSIVGQTAEPNCLNFFPSNYAYIFSHGKRHALQLVSKKHIYFGLVGMLIDSYLNKNSFILHDAFNIYANFFLLDFKIQILKYAIYRF